MWPRERGCDWVEGMEVLVFFFYYCKNIIFLKYKLNFLKIKNIFFLLKETTVSPTKHMEYAVLV
jgi:hypothetical protein